MALPAIHSRPRNRSNERRPAAKRLSFTSLKAKMRRKQQRRREMREMERRIEKVREEMHEIGEEQRKIREGQREVGLKSQALASECRKLREETDAIFKQSAVTQQRLALMFGILRARDNNDSATANLLAQRLRETISSHKENI